MDVVFVVMPFADIERPSIGVSLLKARIASLGFTARVAYCNLDFAERIGYDSFRQISDGLSMNSIVGEWFFADTVFGNDIPPEYEYVDKTLSRCAAPPVIANILAARNHRKSFISQCVDSILADHPRVVALTSTFDQTCACLSVAKEIKSRPDPPIVIMGGANCEGEMGHQLLLSAPWLDFVCTGEGDHAFPLFLEYKLREKGDALPSGIIPQGKAPELTLPAVVEDLDALPIPDYTDFMSRVEASTLKEKLKPVMLIESSRGCWWGAKQHCTFCGLNGRTMTYRSKSVDRVFNELSFLAGTYGVKRISSVDNILDVRYIANLFPRLRDSGLGLEMFYEVKANLRLDQLTLLKEGGVTAIQPGIESLDNDVLRRMKKGCTGLQNLQLLRWSQEVGITVAWNILGGFPGEAAESYSNMARLIPLLTHLTPPASCSPIRLDRFSPFFTHAESYGMHKLRPTSAYYYCFPFGRRELKRLAYFFDFDYVDGRHPGDYMRPVTEALGGWWQASTLPADQQPRLDAEWPAEDRLIIHDTRSCATQPTFSFSGAHARLYAACDSVQSVHGLVRDLKLSEESVKSILDQFIECKLMVEMEARYLSLAVVKNRATQATTGVLSDHIPRYETASAEPLLRIV
jgi:ribosomal peptide maturation radical SAM protein 1